jgi:GT2 family glycosyltransferase
MENKETVCAVVVTYNRKELLIECLDALCKQTRSIDALYIIDNFSSDGTAEFLFENGYINKLPPKNLDNPFEIEITLINKPKIYYLRMNENTGGAGGFHEGVKRGYDKGYKWLWLMDDDAEPYNNSLEILFEFLTKENKFIPALACSVINVNDNYDLMHRGVVNFGDMFPSIQKPIAQELYDNEFIEIETASFVGLLVNSSVIDQIGLPEKDFFIHNDDIEYCLRLNKIGKIILVPKSKIRHKEVSAKEKIRIVPYDKLWLRYFAVRNIIILSKTYSTNKSKFYFKLLKYTIRNIRKILFYGDNKLKRLSFLFNQISDGLNSHIDNNKPKKILY